MTCWWYGPCELTSISNRNLQILYMFMKCVASTHISYAHLMWFIGFVHPKRCCIPILAVGISESFYWVGTRYEKYGKRYRWRWKDLGTLPRWGVRAEPRWDVQICHFPERILPLETDLPILKLEIIWIVVSRYNFVFWLLIFLLPECYAPECP